MWVCAYVCVCLFACGWENDDADDDDDGDDADADDDDSGSSAKQQHKLRVDGTRRHESAL